MAKPQEPEDIGAQLENLRRSLAKAKALGDAGKVHSRVAAHGALLGVLDFLRAVPGLRTLAGPLDDLNKALLDVAREVPSDFFATAKSHGRPQLSARDLNIKAFAVLSVELLLAAGMSQPAALKLAAETFNRAGVRTGRDQRRLLTVSVMRSWREGVTGRGDDAYTAERLAAMKREMTAAGAWPPTAERARDLVKTFAGLAART